MNAYDKLSDETLSALVAEKIMGWHRVTDHDYRPPQVNWVDATGSFQKIVNCQRQLEGLQMWTPASDIADAMQVVEKLMEQGMVVILKGDGLRIGKSPRWTVLCGNQPRLDSESLPRSICIAALQTL